VEGGDLRTAEFVFAWQALIDWKPGRQSAGRPVKEVLSAYSLSGLFNASRPKSFGYRHEDPDTGLSDGDRQTVANYNDEAENVLVKRIWVKVDLDEAGQVSKAEFFLKHSDMKLMSQDLGHFLEVISHKGCTVGCCGVQAYQDLKSVWGGLLGVLKNPGELECYLTSLSSVERAANARAMELITDVSCLLAYLDEDDDDPLVRRCRESRSKPERDGLRARLDEEREVRNRQMAKLRHQEVKP